MSKLSGKYTAEELLTIELLGSKPLIDKFIYERDNILLVGKEKANKSTFAMQMCCHLTSAEPFLGEYEIPRAIDCVYLQAEGKLASTQSNLRNMTKVIPIDKSKLLFLYYPSIPLNKPEGIRQILSDIDSWRRPELVVIDPLYQTMSGDIANQPDSTAMTANLRSLSEHYACSILLTHHAHRARRDESGAIVDEGDDSVFGSFVWKAFPDTVMLIEKVRGSRIHRKYSCGTQRMGNVIESLELNLIEPTPFYIEVRDCQPIDSLIISAINGNGSIPIAFTISEICTIIKRHRNHVSRAIHRLIGQNKVEIIDQNVKPFQFKIC